MIRIAAMSIVLTAGLMLSGCGKKGEIVADDRIIKVDPSGLEQQPKKAPDQPREFILDPLL